MTKLLETLRARQSASTGKTLQADYPIALRVHHLAEIYGVSVKRMYERVEDGEFDFAELKPRTQPRTWSRDRVQAQFDGTLEGLTPKRGSLRRTG